MKLLFKYLSIITVAMFLSEAFAEEYPDYTFEPNFENVNRDHLFIAMAFEGMPEINVHQRFNRQFGDSAQDGIVSCKEKHRQFCNRRSEHFMTDFGRLHWIFYNLVLHQSIVNIYINKCNQTINFLKKGHSLKQSEFDADKSDVLNVRMLDRVLENYSSISLDEELSEEHFTYFNSKFKDHFLYNFEHAVDSNTRNEICANTRNINTVTSRYIDEFKEMGLLRTSDVTVLNDLKKRVRNFDVCSPLDELAMCLRELYSNKSVWNKERKIYRKRADVYGEDDNPYLDDSIIQKLSLGHDLMAIKK